MKQERLQKVIANLGYTSRRQAEKLIINNRVKVNGEIVNELGKKVDVNAIIEIDSQEIIPDNTKHYYLFNKPRLVLTTMYDPEGRPTVAEYFKDIPTRVYPVGRLDYDVSGLIIMTNDGELANFIMHPRYEFTKTYQALCKGEVAKKQINKLLDGVRIENNYFTKALDAKFLNYNSVKEFSIIELTIAEGKKHHVKQMLKAANINLIKLKRTGIEFLTDENLEIGKFRSLKVHEIKKLYGIFNSIRKS